MCPTAPFLHPRTFASPGEALSDIVGVLGRTGPLVAVYLRGRLDPELRERVMVAVSRINACRDCTFVHERWAIRSGVTSDELAAIGLSDFATLDDRSRAAVLFATARAESHFRGPVPSEVAAYASSQLTPKELAAVEAVARAMAVANLSVSTLAGFRARMRM
jgi:alkylhydroperoxidase AhpD family core domain